MTQHAVFSPSASERWIACPASHLRSLALPRPPSSPYADRGTLLHKYAAIGASTQLLRVMYEHAKTDGVVLAADECDALRTYVNFVKGLRKDCDLWGVEQRVGYTDELFGTIDVFVLKGDTLHIVDFKGGRGVLVEAEDNPQLLTYAMLVNLWLQSVTHANGSMRPVIDKVALHIVQPLFPGAPPIRSATYPISKLAAWYSAVQAAMLLAKQPTAPFNPGAHCRFCPVKPNCPALLGLAAQLPAPVEQAALPVAKLAEWLGKADVIEQWIAALREHAHGLIEQGAQIPGWKLQDKRATRKWSDEEQVLEVAKANRIRAQGLKLLSPTQLEKKYKVIPLALKPFVEQTPSGKNLVRDPSTAAADNAKEQPALESALLNLQYRV